LPYLKSLDLRFEGVPRKPIVISNGGFAKLQRLAVHSRLPRITFQEGAMPSLVILQFEFQFYLVRLHHVSFRRSAWYRGGISPCINATINVVIKEAWEHPNRISVGVSVRGQETVVFQTPEIAESSEDSNEASSSGAIEIEEIQA
jgi:hypothetical protein